VSTEPEISGAIVPAAVTPPAEGGLSALGRAAVDAGKSPATRRAYERDWREFISWCAQEGRDPLPCTAETLAEYAAYLCYRRQVLDRSGLPVSGAVGVSPSSARRMIGSVQAAHKHAGLRSPRTAQVSLVLKGYEAKLADERDPRARPRKATPLTPVTLAEMTGRGLSGAQELIRARNTAMLYLTYNTAARASELVRVDIDGVTEHDWGLAVLLRRSKGGPFEEVLIPAEHAPAGVAAIRKWITVLREHGITSGPLFRNIDKNGVIDSPRYKARTPDGRIAALTAERIVAAMAAEAGLEGRYTVHSGRRGMATQARMAGHDELAIARHGGWKDGSTSLKGYIDEADRLRLNPLRGAGA
jgi:site-specific recombinase XerD